MYNLLNFFTTVFDDDNEVVKWVSVGAIVLLIALLVALVDILPILGVGTVLIPWSIIEILFVKDAFTGVGLLILYAIVSIIRQVTEPKVVAGSLGLDPLLTIIVIYAGLKIFGIFGMILGPMAALGAKAFFKGSGVQNG